MCDKMNSADDLFKQKYKPTYTTQLKNIRIISILRNIMIFWLLSIKDKSTEEFTNVTLSTAHKIVLFRSATRPRNALIRDQSN